MERLSGGEVLETGHYSAKKAGIKPSKKGGKASKKKGEHDG